MRKYLSEEDTFWLMVVVIESYLPPDFYVEMYGATTHATILYKIMKQYSIMKELLQTFETLEYPLVNLTAKLYLSLFAHSLPEQASLRVLDMFLLEGMHENKIIFDVTLGYLKVIEPMVIQCQDQESLHEAMKAENCFVDLHQFIQGVKQARKEI